MYSIEQAFYENKHLIANNIEDITDLHIAALKACVAIETMQGCDNDRLIELLNIVPDEFEIERSCVTYKSSQILFTGDDTVMLIGQYFLKLTKDKNYWSCSHKDNFGNVVGGTAIEAVCNCVANLNNMELDI